jgi:hypothetical protein
MDYLRKLLFFIVYASLFASFSTLSQSGNSYYMISDEQFDQIIKFRTTPIDIPFRYNNNRHETPRYAEINELSDSLGIIIKADMDIDTDGAEDANIEDCPGTGRNCKDLYHDPFTSFRYPHSQKSADAKKIPYFVLPGNKTPYYSHWGFDTGDVGIIINKTNRRLIFAIFGDIGPDPIIGEGSLFAAKQLGNCPCTSDPEELTGIDENVFYIVFRSSKKLINYDDNLAPENIIERITKAGLDLLKTKFGIELK